MPSIQRYLVVFLATALALVVCAITPNVTASSSQTQAEPDNWFSDSHDSVVVRAWFNDRAMLQQLADRMAPWTINREQGYAVVEVTRFERVEIEKLGLRLELDEARTRELHQPRVRDVRQSAGITGFECYRTVEETFSDAEDLAQQFPNLVEWIDIGDSWEKTTGAGGYDMRVLKITNQAVSGEKPILFAMSAVHARELTTAELNMRFAEYLLQNYATNADARWLVDHHELHLSIQSNPDGRLQAETLLPWRKNTNENYCGATSSQRGADLNRNFEFNWGCCGGSSPEQCSGIYRGPSAASEPETAAIQDYVRTIFDDQRGEGLDDAAPLDATGVFVDIHSFSQLVLYPWGFINQGAPNENELRAMARKLAFFNDYNPIPITGLTIADGSTVDFAYGELGVAAFAFELGTNFFEDCADFENTVFPDNLEALIYAAKTARAPYLLSSGPDLDAIAFDRNTVLQGASVQLFATASDERFSENSGIEPVQPVVAVSAYIDTPPWQAGAVALSAEAVDGAFDEATEDTSITLDIGTLPLGEHAVYLQATDGAGADGVVSAQFVYVLDAANAATISGRVAAADSGAGLLATVTAGTSQTLSDPVSGAYSLTIQPGTYTVNVVPNSDAFDVARSGSVTVAAGASTTVDISVFPFCALFEDDVETDQIAWTPEDTWARSTESSNSPSFAWTDSPSDRYANNANTALTSPPIDLSDSTQATLEYAQRCSTQPFSDFCIVEVSTDGTAWVELERYDGFSADPSVFTPISISLDSVAGESAVQIRFRLESDGSIQEDGWFIDDISVETSGPACVASADTDGDGVVNSMDNCTLLANSLQTDADGDGFGNVCDTDFNNDGVTNFLDLSIFAGDFLSTGDLVTDVNNDGVVNFIDLITVRDFFLLPPGPSGVAAVR